MVLLHLLQNSALDITMLLLYLYFGRIFDNQKLKANFLTGLFFGAICVLSMLSQTYTISGSIYDGKTIVLTVAGVFCGPIVASVAAVIAAIFRVFYGGPGVVPGVLVILCTAAISSLYNFLATTKKISMNMLSLALLSYLVHIIMLAAQFLLPGHGWVENLPRVAPAVMLFYPPAFLLISKIFIESRAHQAEQDKLLENESRYHGMFADNVAVMLLIDPGDGRIVDANPAAARYYGWSMETLRSMSIDQIDVAGKETTRFLMREVVDSRQNLFLLRHRIASGEIRNVEVSASCIHLKSNTLIYSIIRDVTEREKAFYERNLLFDAIDKSFNEIYIENADDLHFTYASQGALKNLGYTMEELHALTPLDIKTEMSEEAYKTHLSRLLSGESPSAVFRTIHQRKDGSKYPVEVRLNLHVSGSTKVFLAIVSDITYLIEADEKIKTLNANLEKRIEERTAELKATNEELNSFSYSVSHDLRAPLRAIDGFVRILSEDYGSSLDDEGKRVCSVISQSAQRMGKLIDDLLEFSRTGKTVVHLSLIDMQTMVKEVFNEITTESERKRIEFTVRNLPPVAGDPILLRQVWINLIGNAIKYSSKMERSNILVSAEAREEQITYSIQDNGAGFDMEYANKLFKVFQRLHSQEEFDGTGIGLALANRIIHKHGGRIWAKSEVGKGATFYFSLDTGGHA